MAQPVKRGRLLLGHVEQIQYTKRTAEGIFSYFHPFETHAQPELWRDGRGKLFGYGCAYTITDAGIEDMPEGRFVRVCVNTTPKRLVDLGTLEFLRYRDGRGQSRLLRFYGKAAPTVCTDEDGRLHFVGGTYRIEREVNTTMARRRRSRRSGRHSAIRFNPIGGSQMAAVKKYGLAFLATGAAVYAGVKFVLPQLSSRLPVAWSPYLKAGVVAAAGIGAGVLAYKYAPKQVAPVLGTALGAGAVFASIGTAHAQLSARTGAGVFALPPGRSAGIAHNAYARARSAA